MSRLRPNVLRCTSALQVMRELAARAAATIQNGGTVAVNCLSGRGRTGTFISIILGELHNIKTYSELVDRIVDLRRRRDGLVETPAQFKFVARTIGLPDPSSCGVSCKLRGISAKTRLSTVLVPFLFGMVGACVLGAMIYLWRLRQSILRANTSGTRYRSISKDEAANLATGIELRPQNPIYIASTTGSIKEDLGLVARRSLKQGLDDRNSSYQPSDAIIGFGGRDDRAGADTFNLDSQSTENEDRKTI
jgi:hypothetical protein